MVPSDLEKKRWTPWLLRAQRSAAPGCSVSRGTTSFCASNLRLETVCVSQSARPHALKSSLERSRTLLFRYNIPSKTWRLAMIFMKLLFRRGPLSTSVWRQLIDLPQSGDLMQLSLSLRGGLAVRPMKALSRRSRRLVSSPICQDPFYRSNLEKLTTKLQDDLFRRWACLPVSQ